MAALYSVIMAGGRGERFWPLSTSSLPKPFIPLTGANSLIQETVARIQPIVPLERILISIGTTHLDIARKQLPQLPPENFIVEPMGRDTSACLAFCALHIEKRDPAGTMLALPADHFVSDAAAFRRIIQTGVENLDGATGVIFGIQPERPETGYGYILAEKPVVKADAWPVVKFIEKPDAATAAQYVASGNYFWNSGMFLFRNQILLSLFQKHMPDTHEKLCKMRPLLAQSGTDAEVAEIFSTLQRISIDFGIMEKTSGLSLIPAQFGWDDIGSWAALERALPADASGNVAQGPHIALESNGCIIYSQSDTIAAFGVSDLVIVQAYGKILICPKSKAADLKRLVSALGPQ
jgi:mannose-1-phosphate guanylyltransferase